jgi:hypothetical protein
MPKRLRLKEHLSTEELEARYRKAHYLVLRSHYQIVWLLSLGKLTREVREVTGYSPEWIREISLRSSTSWEPKGLVTAATKTPVPLLCSPPQSSASYL